MNQTKRFLAEAQKNIERLGNDAELQRLSLDWLIRSAENRYSYNFTWMGRPLIQYPPDLIALQEIIWRTKPDVIIETGVAHGGSLVFYASLLAALGDQGDVIGIDIDIRSHNREAIETHPMHKRIRLFEGSSIAEDIVAKVREAARGCIRPMVVLDSDHTHDHVLQELRLYSSIVRKGGYLVVLDTIVEDLPENFFPNRAWGKGNNPKTAVHAFLKENDRFEIDSEMDQKLLITTAPNGYLRCVKD